MPSQGVVAGSPTGLALDYLPTNKLSIDLDPAWAQMKKYESAIRNYVFRGGRYAGFCLGAYLAGRGPGFDLLPPDSDTDEESIQPGAQVKNHRDTVIQVDWWFRTGARRGQLQNGRWMYFQDGAVMKLEPDAPAVVLGRYSANGDVAASVTSFGDGWVGLVGPHPEADLSWCEFSFFCSLLLGWGYALVGVL